MSPSSDALRLCAALYSLPLIALKQPVLDPDIWWHLRTGQWLIAARPIAGFRPFLDLRPQSSLGRL